MKRRSLLGMILGMLFLAGCSEPVADEAQIRQSLEQMVQGIEQRDMEAFIRPFAADFTGEAGMDRRAIRWLALRQSQQHEQIHIQLAQIEVELLDQLDPPRAKVRFHALLSGGSWLPRDAGWYQVETGWRKDGEDQWRIISANWQKQL